MSHDHSIAAGALARTRSTRWKLFLWLAVSTAVFLAMLRVVAYWPLAAGRADGYGPEIAGGMTYAGIAVLTLLFVGTIVATWLTAEAVARDAAKVRTAAIRIAPGTLAARAGVRDETGGLTTQVNTMAPALSGRDSELIQRNRDLEATVQRLDEQLQRSEAQFHAVVDRLPSGIMLADPEGGMLFVNEQARQWLNARDRHELLGAHPEDFFSPPTAKEMARFDHATTDGSVIREDEMRIAWPDGRERTMLVSKFPVMMKSGDLLALGTVATDISAIRAAEAQARRNEAILRSILDQSPVAFSLKDTQRNFLMVNKIGADWFGYDPDTMIGAASDELIPAGQVDMFAKADRLVLERQEVSRPFEYRNESPSRPSRDLMVVKFPVWGAEGEMIGIGTIQTDITERKRAEEELRRAYTVIRESVQYASKMQRTLLPDEEDRVALGEHLMIWEPRDMVGGDLFWLRRTTKGILVIVGDGTGHGVPGAFVTLVATSALNQALLDHPDGDPAAVLQHMNSYVKYMLRQDVQDGEADDGMELGLCHVAHAEGRTTFAGARFSLFKISGTEAKEIKGDKVGIGYRRTPVAMTFANHVLEADPSATYYLVTDGYIDQIGGEKRRAFGKRRLLNKLLEIQDVPLTEQRGILMAALDEYRGDEPRRDDVTIVGFRVAAPPHLY